MHSHLTRPVTGNAGGVARESNADDGARLLDAAGSEFKQHEQSFRLLFDSNPVPMWLMDVESLRFIAVNDAAVKHYGFPREQFLTMTTADIRLPQDRDNFSQYIRSGANSQGHKLWHHRKANGDTILVSVYSGDLAYDGRAARLCAVVDVTERNLAEEKLRAQKIQIDTAMNNMSQGVLMFDCEGRLMLCNGRYIEMYKLSPDVVKPGCTLRQLIEHRRSVGFFSGDIDEYCRDIMAEVAKGRTKNRIVELSDGRSVHAVNHPIAGGGWVATHEDITERTRAQSRLAQETNENRRLFETSLDLILVTDRYGTLERVSPICSAILGYAPDEMIGRNGIDFVYADDLEDTRQEMRLARKGHEMRNFEARYAHKDGRVITLAWSGVWSEPEQKHFFTGRDVTERKIVDEKLRHLAHYDQLTGLANRVSLHDDLHEAIRSSGGSPASATSIAMFDLDGFKDINDTLGHSTGDRLLQEVARRMTELATGNGRFYRLGGDEFVMVKPDCGDPREIARITDTVLNRLAEKFEINGHQLFVGASAGIAIAPADGTNVEELISNADLALYDAKAAGGNVYRLFIPVLRAKAHARRELDVELRRACANKEFELYFQPQVRALGGAVVGAEALLRWRHPQRGILAPGAFIEALSESPVVLEVGRWILQVACEQAAAWRAMGLPPLRMGVNLFPAQFHGETLLKDVDAALRRSGLPAEALEIEITENIALGQEEATLEALRTLRGKGVNLAFDDFGTGYASLSYLARYPLTRIKIDQSFVRKISDASSPEDTAIVRSIIVMAHNLGLAVIAEGVETAAQAAFLRMEKCEELQGYLYAKPLVAGEFEAYLRAGRAQAVGPAAAALAG
jgi:diguanylate cyclase (GGDEF)-like protein/PAS domain S-box-containing protein